MTDVEDDRTPGTNQGFTVTLFNAVGADLLLAAANGVILNHDSEIGISPAQADRAEGDAGEREQGSRQRRWPPTLRG